MQSRGWYRGDCHVHSVFSDGELTPEQLAAAARAAGLDFVATTEHNNTEAYDAWAKAAGTDLLVIPGEEVTTQTGHWLALGIRPGQVVDWRYGVRDRAIGRHLHQVHDSGGLCVAAHPHGPYPSGRFRYPYAGFDVVEVWNGRWASELEWNADNETALADWSRALTADVAERRWRPAMGNSDTHLENQIGIPQTVVRADEPNQAAILAGIRAGRSWIAESAAVQLSLTLESGGRTAEIGDRLATSGATVVVRAEVGGVPGGTVSFHTDGGRVHHEPAAGPVEWRTNAEESAFVRVEVRHPHGHMAALTNPVILD